MGGNVFTTADKIEKDNIEYTLKEYFKELTNIFPNKGDFFKDYITLGSVGKKDISGDIDLAFDDKKMLPDFWDASIEPWGISPLDVKETYVKMRKRVRTSTERQTMVRAFLQELVKYINKMAPNIYCDDKKVTSGGVFTLFPQYSKDGKLDKCVQIDWMIGNIEWLKFSYYSDVYAGNVKGLHRTQLMLAMFTNKGYIFNHTAGVRDKETDEVVANTPTDAIELLNKIYNIELNYDILSNFFKLNDYIKDNVSTYEYIMKTYFKILDSTRCDIPDVLQPLWIDKKDEWSLTGKFIPNDSKLKDI